MASLKGPGAARTYDGNEAPPLHSCSLLSPPKPPYPAQNDTNKNAGSDLRIGIIHARWNSTLIAALLEGTKKSLRAAGVKEENIIVSSVPGSWELPFGVQR